MASDPGHRYSFGAPAGGWPTFDPSGCITPTKGSCMTTSLDDRQATVDLRLEALGAKGYTVDLKPMRLMALVEAIAAAVGCSDQAQDIFLGRCEELLDEIEPKIEEQVRRSLLTIPGPVPPGATPGWGR